MLDIALVAQAACSEASARYVCERLDLTRRPADPGDAAALAFFRKLVPCIERHPGDAAGLREAASQAGLSSVVDYALYLPQWLVDRFGPTRTLVTAFNDGGATHWRPNGFGEPADRMTSVLTSTARPLGDWLQDVAILRPPVTVVPQLAVTGRVTLLSGREKIGKSTLVAGAVAAASRGDAVLGVRVDHPVRTLWFALDEHVADTVRRFDRLAANKDSVIINSAPRTDTELVAALELDLAACPGIELVVVDTLSRVLSASSVDPNSSREVEPVIARLVDLFHRHDVAAVLLYHTGKGGVEYRGSTAIGATVDEVLTLRRRGQKADADDFDDEEKDDGRRLLVQDGRNLRGRLQLTCSNGVYGPYDNAVPLRSRVIEELRLRGSVKNRSELAKLVTGRRNVVLEAISGLIADGTISETSKRLSLLSVSSGASKPREPEPLPEPTATVLQFPSSHRFPEGGTGSEPLLEPTVLPVSPLGSRFETPPVQKREPEPEKLI